LGAESGEDGKLSTLEFAVFTGEQSHYFVALLLTDLFQNEDGALFEIVRLQLLDHIEKLLYRLVLAPLGQK